MNLLSRKMLLVGALMVGMGAGVLAADAPAGRVDEIKKQSAELKSQAGKLRGEVLKSNEAVKPLLAQIADKDKEKRALEAQLEAKVAELNPEYKALTDKLKALDDEAKAIRDAAKAAEAAAKGKTPDKPAEKK